MAFYSPYTYNRGTVADDGTGEAAFDAWGGIIADMDVLFGAMSIDSTSYDVTYTAGITLVGDLKLNGGSLQNILIDDFSATGASGGIRSEQSGGGTIKYFQSSTSLTTVATHAQYYNPNGKVGDITTTGSATAYNTSSDPRLKSEFTTVSDLRLMEMPPEPALAMICDAVENKGLGKFHFLSDTNAEVWGYNAHWLIDNQVGFGGTAGEGGRELELGSILIPAVMGKDKKGNTIELESKKLVTPAGVDQSKRVPILETAIYELLKRIEILENN